ncbi:1-deoxy-D-xylulose-5-phosphate synthase [uncultured Eubacterium sp.]|uniref:1-deoxy-D-xylulose-5-phosphate synthase n=1 Tax=uncultured Eubacterium sp. TaxID=165185 RepID=UPI0025D3DD37|nr:1-deoxy-D-xylulose-5-phosphate synthase [uncultured Eubacterium sp.]
MAVLDRINQANDIKYLSEAQLEELPGEIRQFLIEHISKTGGHLASNLGVVELTMALHLVLNFPEDKLIWDVGHQSYTHKILTGRKREFEHLRQLDGMSGFPKRSESDCDAFDTGHSSTSISAGLGYARARDLLGEDYHVVSVIGDGALTGGPAFEALNNAAELHTNMIIVLNDNKMSISENVGGLSQHLASLRTAEAYQEFKSGVHSSLERLPYGERVVRRIRKTKSSLKQLLIPGMIFENMGITYLGPVDGHNLTDMVRILREAKKVNGAVVVHVQTEKGRGYEPAELHPDRFHGTGPFDIPSGQPLVKKDKPNYTDVFSTVICKIAAKNDSVVAITAAMADGTGLKRFRAEYPTRFFDVGIAEGHAVTFAAGLAAAGLHPVFAVYSSFLQRGFDQIVHDVCMQNLPVVFAIDRAGLVGADGETHQGVFDLSFLGMIPNMIVLAPKNKWELADMLRFAFRQNGPVALRYPRGQAYAGLKEHRAPIVYGKSEWIYEERQIAIFAVGNMLEEAVKVHELLHEQGYDCSLNNVRFVKPLDKEALRKAAEDHLLIVTMEENILRGGFGYAAAAYLSEADETVKVLHFGIDDQFVQHGTVSQLHARIGLDAESMADKIIETYQKL